MYQVLRPGLFALSPTRAHALALAALGPLEWLWPLRAGVRAALTLRHPGLEVRKLGLVFPTPIGLAGGFDKNAERPRALAALGFGFLELGTVTALAQEANPAPNMFRLAADRALVNRLGFPNDGAEAVAARLGARRRGVDVPVAVSIGKSRAVPLEPLEGAIADYLTSFRAVAPVADFVIVNVSSPNTKDLRALQVGASARPLFSALAREAEAGAARRVPLLVKIAPDLEDEAIDAVCDAAMGAGFDGVVATNTTIARAGLRSDAALVTSIGAGGLSGRPLGRRSLEVVRRVRARIGPSACVIGVGGIDDVASARAMLDAGADLLQIYTGLVYEGPGLPRRLARGLLEARVTPGR